MLHDLRCDRNQLTESEFEKTGLRRYFGRSLFYACAILEVVYCDSFHPEMLCDMHIPTFYSISRIYNLYY